MAVIGKLFPVTAAPWPTVGVLAALALCAELLPVHLPRRGLRVTLTLPFIAGIASITGPVVALTADSFATLLGGLIIAWSSNERIQWRWLTINVAIAAVSAGIAGIVREFVSSRTVAPMADLAFVACYVALNFVIVTRINSGFGGRSYTEIILKSVRPGAFGLVLYALIGVGVCSTVRQNHDYLLPLLFLPVLALRWAIVVVARSEQRYYETMVALTLMLQRAHPYTHRHLERVGRLAERVALNLGLSPKRAAQVREAAVLHDIGKIAIDEEILDKPGRLSEDEMEHVRLHPEFGAAILQHSCQLQALVPWIRSHHERPDGTGYPERLGDKDIPIESKIIAVTDAFDAMVGGAIPGEVRSYRAPMETSAALAELERCSGTQFDPQVVHTFRRIVEGDYVA